MQIVTTAGIAQMEVQFTAARDRGVHHVRLLANSLVMIVVDDRLLASRVAMAASELAENSVKSNTATLSVLRVKIDPATSKIRIETENEATAADIELLRRHLAVVNDGTPAESYMRALAAVPTANASAGHVGLARVRFEGQMTLRLEVDGRRVRMVAET